MTQVHENTSWFRKSTEFISDELKALGNGGVADLSVGEVIHVHAVFEGPLNFGLILPPITRELSADQVKNSLPFFIVGPLHLPQLGLKLIFLEDELWIILGGLEEVGDE
jgi:hypothetical protein